MTQSLSHKITNVQDLMRFTVVSAKVESKTPSKDDLKLKISEIYKKQYELRTKQSENSD